MREELKDIVRYAGSLPLFEVVKVTCDEDGTKITSVDNNKTVVLKGYLKEPLGNLNGSFGMTSMDVLKGLLDFPNFKSDNASIEMVTKDNSGSGKTNPVEIKFRDEQGQEASYRLTDPNQLSKDYNTTVNIEWDVIEDFEPQSSKIKEFTHFANLYSAFQDSFKVVVENNQLKFHIGDENDTSHKAFVIMSDDVSSKSKCKMSWPTSQVISILKLGQNCKTTLSISSNGLMGIKLESDKGEWNYYLPALRKN